MAHFLIDLPYQARAVANDPEAVQLFFGARLARIDLRTGEAQLSKVDTFEGHAVASVVEHQLTREPVQMVGALRFALIETRTGPRTVVSDGSGRETILSGTLRHSFVSGSRVVGVVHVPERGIECVAFVVG